MTTLEQLRFALSNTVDPINVIHLTALIREEMEKEPEETVGYIHGKCAEQRHKEWQEENKHIHISPGDYCKIAFQDGDKMEHMWVKVDGCIAQRTFTGILRNDPVAVTNIRCDDPVHFNRENIEEYIPGDK
jgi:uncharacterized protein YegJ (DUF2314 family)